MNHERETVEQTVKSMDIDVITLFPEMFTPLSVSILKRAQDKQLIHIGIHQLRDYTHDKHRIVDDAPFGGGDGMVMKPEPLFEAVEQLRRPDTLVVLMCPKGEVFDQRIAKELASYSHLLLVCGHYEGVDERVRTHLVNRELSIGDYVLTGGELPAMVVIDSVARMLPGVLGAVEGAAHDSFYHGLLEYPHYTRPATFRGWRVPDVLLSGNHGQIDSWRVKEALRNTLRRRPDQLQKTVLTEQEQKLLRQVLAEEGDA